MSKLEVLVEELKALPPRRLEQAADYIRRLQTISRTQRNAILRSTADIFDTSVVVDYLRKQDQETRF